MHLIKLALAVAVITPSSATLQGAQSATKHGSGSCGEHKYWHKEKCIDAREKWDSWDALRRFL
jgi:hypothetical protein